MNNTLLGAILGLVGAGAIFFFSRKSSNENAQIINLTSKIKDNQAKEVAAKTTADAAVKEYTDALKAYDPNFYDDDGNGKPSA